MNNTTTETIEYLITGYEADNNLTKGHLHTLNKNQYYNTAKEITNYINLINDTKTNTQTVYNTILKITTNNNNYNQAKQITKQIKTYTLN